jgi:imidazole glycerol-phosphate synthase subunit HisH
VSAPNGSTIAVVDSGSGNLRSVERALALAGGRPRLTSDPDEVRRADRLVVPGQGAFGDCVESLAARGLDDAIREFCASGRPYLGICLGLQILFEDSEEASGPGLGILRGRVVRLPRAPGLKVPHMGWNDVIRRRDDPLLHGMPEGAHFYFVHSYHAVPADPDTVVLSCDYGVEVTAAVRAGNLFACQFHPEKSQAAGRALLERFVTAD